MTNHYQRVAVVQAAPLAFNKAITMARVEEHARMAAAQGAQLVVFPEAFIGGYPKGADFGARVGSRSDEGREWFRRYFDGAVTLPGPELQQLRDLARELKMVMVMGLIERDGGTLYCTTVMLNNDGSYLGKHRKLMPTGIERLIWGFGDGATMPVVDSAVGRIGSAICWENYMPQYRLALYQQNIQLYCISTVDDRDNWLMTMRHIALEGRCFVLSACQYTRRADFPEDFQCNQGNDPDTVLIRGGSCIVDPLGRMLVEPVYNQTTVLCADLDMNEITRGKYDLDVVGHYARPDIFTLQVNTKPQQVATSSGGQPIGLLQDHKPL